MKHVENNFFILFLCLVMCSCQSYRFVNHGREIKDFKTYYNNDSLKLSLKFFGDYGDYNLKRLSKTETKVLKTIANKASTQVLFSALTTIAPTYHTIASFRNPNSVDLSKYSLKKQDSLSYLYQLKQDKKYSIYETILPFQQQFISLIFWVDKHETENIDDILGDISEMSFDNVERIKKNITTQEVANPFNIANDAFNNRDEKNYLAAEYLLKNEKNYNTPTEKNGFYQALATYYSFSNQLKEANEAWGKAFGDNSKQDSVSTVFVPAKKEILNQVYNSQVVMFNEAHHHPEHRYFVGTMLKDFYDFGFRYLALETIENADSLNNAAIKIPTFRDGFYIRNTTYANMIKYALDLGYKLVDYDAWTAPDRELGQAKNLYDKTLKNEPQAKVIVLAGYDHINEVSEGGKSWMATRFREISGINPVTINQTYSIIKKNEVINPNHDVTVIKKSSLPQQNDIYLSNNLNLENTNNCFQENSQTITIEVPQDSLIKNQKHALCIYKKSELEKAPNSIPVFVAILDKGQNKLTTNLCSGTYIVKCKAFFDIIWQKEILVK